MFNLFKKKKQQQNFNRTEVEKLQQQIETIQEISNLLVSGASLETSLDQIAHLIPRVFGIQYVGLMLLDRVKDGKYQFTLVKTAMPDILEGFVHTLVRDRLENLPYIVNNNENVFTKSLVSKDITMTSAIYTGFLPIMTEKNAKRLELFVRLQIKSLVSIPLLVHDKAIGVIALGWNKKVLDKVDEVPLRTFANQASTAIYNTRLFDQTQTQITQLKQKNDELQSLYYLTSQISQTLDPDKVAQTGVNALPVNDLIRGSFIGGVNEDTGELTVMAYSAVKGLTEKVQDLVGDFAKFTSNFKDDSMKDNIIREAIMTRTRQFTNDLEKVLSPPMPKNLIAPFQKLVGVESMCIFPVISRNRVIATVGYLIKNKKIEDLKPNEIQLLEYFSLQITIALENAMTYEVLQKSRVQLATKNKALEESAQRERDMMDIVGHELRTPATIVKGSLGYIEMMKRMDKLSDKKLQEYLQRSSGAIQREITLINTFLGAAKIEGDQMQFDPVKFNVPEVLKTAVKEQVNSAESKGLKIRYLPSENMPEVVADPIRIREVVDNFLNNAIKYSENGTIQVWCDTNKERNKVTVYIKDEGYGISEDDQAKLFKKFGRLKNYSSFKERASRIVRPGGTGLGLYVSKGIVDVHKGEIGVKSALGKGSTFYFSIPTETKIDDKYRINPIFKREGSKDVFVKMGLNEQRKSPSKSQGNTNNNATAQEKKKQEEKKQSDILDEKMKKSKDVME